MGLVFVVVPDVSVRQALARLLEVEGLHVRPVEGVEALLRRHACGMRACAVIDVSDARSWSAETRAALALMSVTVAIIALDASDGLAIRRIARRIGATAYFRTPIDGPALVDAVDWALWREGAAPTRIADLPRLPGDAGTGPADDEPTRPIAPA